MAKKRHNDKAHGRSYIYDLAYEKKHLKDREERNLARRQALAHFTSKYGVAKAKQMLKFKDIDHIKSLSSGGSNKKSNRRIRSRHSNRGDKSY